MMLKFNKLKHGSVIDTDSDRTWVISNKKS